jgi:hypothetical protein
LNGSGWKGISGCWCWFLVVLDHQLELVLIQLPLVEPL